jgi:hypothetical protein
MRAAEDASVAFQVERPSEAIRHQIDWAGLIESFGLAGNEVDRPVDEPIEGVSAGGGK